MDAPEKNRLVVILWFVAAALAFTAFAIDWYKDHDASYTPLAAGVFMLVMAIASWSRLRKS